MAQNASQTKPAEVLWRLIAEIENALPFTKNGIESLLGVELKPESENDYTRFYRLARKPGKGAGLPLREVDLRVSKTRPGDRGFLAIELLDCEVTFQEVKKRYPAAVFEPALPGPPPAGLAPDSVSYLAVAKAWGKISFGFRVREPERLSEIVWAPSPP